MRPGRTVSGEPALTCFTATLEPTDVFGTSLCTPDQWPLAAEDKVKPEFQYVDSALFLMAIAEMNGIDLDSEIERKITKNAAHVYERNPDGVPIRITEALPE